MFYYKNLKIDVPGQVYFPREDSILLATVLEQTRAKRTIDVLEVGCGSGFLSIVAAKLGGKVTSADINPIAAAAAKQNALQNKASLKVLISNLFSNITGKFDLIIFNPPYLPDDINELKDINEQGELKDIKGNWADTGIISRFVQEVKNYLKPGGKVLLLVSSLTQTPAEQLFKDAGFSTKIIAKKKLPWEELIVICACF